MPIGMANIKPSNLSNKPPWPGNITPVSLIFAFLFRRDINRSPNCEIVEITIATKIILLFSNILLNSNKLKITANT